jgi:hypothetical protein
MQLRFDAHIGDVGSRVVMTSLMTMTLALLTSAAPALTQDIDAGPPLGRLVDVGGRRLHLHCSGSAAPTVVIEAGASSFAIDFALVQPEVAKATRVCSYDRAGSGWSDARPDVETPIRVVRDLRALLDAAAAVGISNVESPRADGPASASPSSSSV